MKTIHKICAMVIEDDKFLMVRKKGKDVWTNLGGHPELGETEEESLLREIKEEMGCFAKIHYKIGEFEAPAIYDDAIVRLSVYLVELNGQIIFEDPELEEYRFIDKETYKKLKFPDSIKNKIIPFCVEKGILRW